MKTFKVTLKTKHCFTNGLKEGLIFKILTPENEQNDIEHKAINMSYDYRCFKVYEQKAFVSGFMLAYNNYDYFLYTWKSCKDIFDFCFDHGFKEVVFDFQKCISRETGSFYYDKIGLKPEKSISRS